MLPDLHGGTSKDRAKYGKFITLSLFWCSTGSDWLSAEKLTCNSFVYLDIPYFLFTQQNKDRIAALTRA